MCSGDLNNQPIQIESQNFCVFVIFWFLTANHTCISLKLKWSPKNNKSFIYQTIQKKWTSPSILTYLKVLIEFQKLNTAQTCCFDPHCIQLTLLDWIVTTKPKPIQKIPPPFTNYKCWECIFLLNSCSTNAFILVAMMRKVSRCIKMTNAYKQTNRQTNKQTDRHTNLR